MSCQMLGGESKRPLSSSVKKTVHGRAREGRKPNGHVDHAHACAERWKTNQNTQNSQKKSNLPGRSPESHPEEPKRLINNTNASCACMHTQSGRIDARTAGVVGTPPKKLKPLNLPVGAKNYIGEADGWGITRMGRLCALTRRALEQT